FKGMPGSSVKAVSVPGWKNRPYNAMSTMRTDPILVICEGEPDTWIAHQLGAPAIGLMASDVSKTYKPLMRYRDIVAICHNDENGTISVGKGFGVACADAYGAKPVIMPEGHDLNSFFLEYGEDETLRYIGL
ncbi:MAG TPA: hypothetical protein VLS45_05450, partial [Methylomicrobium sp.]|nr:hypothetical protein [Methylomicrobium sp.]